MSRIEPTAFLELLGRAGVTRLTGVPCSSMTGLIDLAQRGGRVPYANAPGEGEALAYAAGTWLGGGLGAVLCQNSGLGNLYNALTSLVTVYSIPVVMMVGWRGQPGEADEPQHLLMGSITSDLLRLAGVDQAKIAGAEDVVRLDERLSEDVAQRQVLALLLTPGAFENAQPSNSQDINAEIERLSVRRQRFTALADGHRAIDALLSTLPEEAALIATTGLIGRQMWAAGDRPGSFYLTGAMGHAAAVGLGIIEQTGRPTLVVDGDGAVLMRASVLPFVGTSHPRRFAHVVLDNGVHASTGGQLTLSSGVDLAGAASAYGYRHCLDTADIGEGTDLLTRGMAGEGPVFVRLRITAQQLTAPRIRLPLPDLAARMRGFCRIAAVYHDNALSAASTCTLRGISSTSARTQR